MGFYLPSDTYFRFPRDVFGPHSNICLLWSWGAEEGRRRQESALKNMNGTAGKEDDDMYEPQLEYGQDRYEFSPTNVFQTAHSLFSTLDYHYKPRNNPIPNRRSYRLFPSLLFFIRHHRHRLLPETADQPISSFPNQAIQSIDSKK
jgi:hypothetical protein